VIRLRLRSIKIRRWFPPNDDIAAHMATLCILREDFYLELQGIIKDDLAPLDANSTGYRRTYFWRNSLRTLYAIRDTLNSLNAIAEFRAAMAQEPAAVKASFEDGKSALNRASEKFLRELRNQFGGHVDVSRIQEGLNSLEVQQEGMAQLGRTREHTHYMFAEQVLWSAVLREGVDAAPVAVDKVLGDAAELSPALAALDDVIAWYLRSRSS
jgi:hypothetical protein